MTGRGRRRADARSSPPSERKRRGDYPTPPWLVEVTITGVLPALGAGTAPVRVLDPACGDGRFLAAAARWLSAAGRQVQVHGCDIAPAAIEQARDLLAGELATGVTARLEVADALSMNWAGEYDVIVGNPPYLSQLAAATTRGAASTRGGGPYADVAAEFVALAAELIAPGGVIGLVLPQSVLASRDVAAIRAAVDRRCERFWSWWSPRQVFDAAVVVCVLGMRRPADGAAPADPGRPWTDVITGALGVPAMPQVATDGVVGDRLQVSVGFRDVFYGLAAAAVDDPDPRAGPALVTTGMIDPWTLGWGAREVSVNKRRLRHPRVALDALDGALSEWARAQLVPKLLVANQCRVVEAVVDDTGELLPSVPVLSVRPRAHPSTGEPAMGQTSAPELLWAAAAVLASPVATIELWHRQAGTGMSGQAIRLSPAALAAVPWPVGQLADAAALARAGAHEAAVRAVLAAYGLPAHRAAQLLEWHHTWRARGAIRLVGGQNQ